ncbi:MAG: HEAT repeat domain-containing protein, partial [Cytophagales bacterium]|nr:HEAT repeat domain-containing protein [Cytophagales bacterium]
QNKDEEYERLRRQISEELEKPTTLVVLDGLDERYRASEKLLGQAKEGRHKLLLLSRPYGIEQERSLVDLEVEHVGLNDTQMEAYVSHDLSPELGEELLAFIREQPAIEAVAHVPVNLQILCALWQDDGAGVREEIMRGSLPGLYGKLTRYIWKRYEARHKEQGLQNKDREALFDTLGKIALRALHRGEVLISQGLVEKVLEEESCVEEDSRVSKMLQESGLLQSVGSQYQFPHLTFQEYFAGRLLARQLLSSEAKVREKGEKFFCKHKYAPQYGRTLSFLAGEVSKKQEIEDIRKLLSLLEAEPQEVVGVQHLLLQMRLLNEWLCVAGEDEEELGALEEAFHVMDSLVEWFGEGVERVRRKDDSSWDDRQLLSLLTTGLQSSRAVAAQAPALLEPLLAACKDSDEKVRYVASRALAEVAKAAPAQDLEPLLAAGKDSSEEVRSAAIFALAEVAKAAPALAAQVLEPLRAAGKDSEEDVRRAAILALRSLVQAAPGHADQVLEHLRAACKDSEEDVRLAAIYALVSVVKAAPGHADQVLEPLRAAGKDSSEKVRSAASEALAEVAKAAPTQ